MLGLFPMVSQADPDNKMLRGKGSIIRRIRDQAASNGKSFAMASSCVLMIGMYAIVLSADTIWKTEKSQPLFARLAFCVNGWIGLLFR